MNKHHGKLLLTRYNYNQFQAKTCKADENIYDILSKVRLWFTVSGEKECIYKDKKYKLVDNKYILF